jgi:hypothetical protein
MTQLLIKYGNIVLTTTITLLTLYHLCLHLASTSGRLHSEFVRLLFLQAHRETDHFFTVSGVQLAQHDRDQFHFRRAAFASHLKSRVGLAVAKSTVLRINLNIDVQVTYHFKNTYSPITLANALVFNEWMGFNIHLTKISVVHSDRKKRGGGKKIIALLHRSFIGFSKLNIVLAWQVLPSAFAFFLICCK